MTHLHIDSPVGACVALALATSPYAHSLRELHTPHARFSSADLRMLIDSENLRNLERMEVIQVDSPEPEESRGIHVLVSQMLMRVRHAIAPKQESRCARGEGLCETHALRALTDRPYVGVTGPRWDQTRTLIWRWG